MLLRMSPDRAFPVDAVHAWNKLSCHVKSALSLQVFCSRLKAHRFSCSFPDLLCSDLVISVIIGNFVTYLLFVLTYLRTYLLTVYVCDSCVSCEILSWQLVIWLKSVLFISGAVLLTVFERRQLWDVCRVLPVGEPVERGCAAGTAWKWQR